MNLDDIPEGGSVRDTYRYTCRVCCRHYLEKIHPDQQTDEGKLCHYCYTGGQHGPRWSDMYEIDDDTDEIRYGRWHG